MKPYNRIGVNVTNESMFSQYEELKIKNITTQAMFYVILFDLYTSRMKNIIRTKALIIVFEVPKPTAYANKESE